MEKQLHDTFKAVSISQVLKDNKTQSILFPPYLCFLLAFGQSAQWNELAPSYPLTNSSLQFTWILFFPPRPTLQVLFFLFWTFTKWKIF